VLPDDAPLRYCRYGRGSRSISARTGVAVDVDLEISDGEFEDAYLGPTNGVGEVDVLKAILGLYPCAAGWWF